MSEQLSEQVPEQFVRPSAFEEQVHDIRSLQTPNGTVDYVNLHRMHRNPTANRSHETVWLNVVG